MRHVLIKKYISVVEKSCKMGFVLSKVMPGKEETYDLMVVNEFNGVSINSVIVNDDESVLVTGGDDGAIKIWSLSSHKSFECLATLEGCLWVLS